MLLDPATEQTMDTRFATIGLLGQNLLVQTVDAVKRSSSDFLKHVHSSTISESPNLTESLSGSSAHLVLLA